MENTGVLTETIDTDDRTSESAPTAADILCFAKDYFEDPTSNHHVMRSLQRFHHVLWLNSIATRSPNLRQPRDLQKMRRKLGAFTQGTEQISSRLEVATPILLPFPHNRLARAVNRRLLPLEVAHWSQHNGRPLQLWTFLPTAVDYLGRFGESLVVYYCTDEWSEMPGMDGRKVAQQERALCERADVVFTTSQSLYESKRRYNPNTFFSPHGVDHAHFAKALDPDLEVASELSDLPHPILGFFGLLESWVDLELIDSLAQRRPNWSIVLIGRDKTDTSLLRRRPNIRLLGRRRYPELPSFCKGFDLGIIPFRATELTRHVNPIKLREYLSAGLPVVTTPVSGIDEALNRSVIVASDHDRFLAACEMLLKNDSPHERVARSNAQRSQAWDRKVDVLRERVQEASQLRRVIH